MIPKLTYGCHIWQHKLNKTNIRALESLNRRGAVAISAALPGTPTAGLETILNLVPLDIKLKETAMATKARIDTTSKWDGLGHNGKTQGHLHIGNCGVFQQ